MAVPPEPDRSQGKRRGRRDRLVIIGIVAGILAAVSALLGIGYGVSLMKSASDNSDFLVNFTKQYTQPSTDPNSPQAKAQQAQIQPFLQALAGQRISDCKIHAQQFILEQQAEGRNSPPDTLGVLQNVCAGIK